MKHKKHTPDRARRVLTGAILTSVAALAGAAHGADYRVYYLGGQSNMDGYGLNSELDEDQRGPVEGCMIYRGQGRGFGQRPDGAGVWATLSPGFGVGFATDGQTNTLGDRFGPELSFGAMMQQLHPGERIAIIKYSLGGSSLSLETGGATWDPHDRREKDGRVGINQYDHALKTIDEAMRVRDIDGDGEEDRLIPCGIVWMQGESDGMNRKAAESYGEHLGEMMGLLRAALRADGLPVVIGRISDSGVSAGKEPVWVFGGLVQEAQERFCEADPNAALVTSTESYGYSDSAHYDSAGFWDLGQRFARAMRGLEKPRASD